MILIQFRVLAAANLLIKKTLNLLFKMNLHMNNNKSQKILFIKYINKKFCCFRQWSQQQQREEPSR